MEMTRHGRWISEQPSGIKSKKDSCSTSSNTKKGPCTVQLLSSLFVKDQESDGQCFEGFVEDYLTDGGCILVTWQRACVVCGLFYQLEKPPFVLVLAIFSRRALTVRFLYKVILSHPPFFFYSQTFDTLRTRVMLVWRRLILHSTIQGYRLAMAKIKFLKKILKYSKGIFQLG